MQRGAEGTRPPLSGLLHRLLDLQTPTGLLRHPQCGASWEGFVISELLTCLRVPWDRAWFWGTHNGAELDLLIDRDGQRLGFEIKRTSSPRTTRSMHHAIADLGLHRLDVVYSGEHVFPLTETIRAVPVQRLLEVYGDA